MAFAVSWDQDRFPEGTAFPHGLENWPGWLVDAIHQLADHGTPFPWDSVTSNRGPPAVYVLSATEPNMKVARHRVTLVLALNPAGEKTLVVSDVR